MSHNSLVVSVFDLCLAVLWSFSVHVSIAVYRNQTAAAWCMSLCRDVARQDSGSGWIWGLALLNLGPSIKYVKLEGERIREGVTVCDRGRGSRACDVTLIQIFIKHMKHEFKVTFNFLL